MRSTSRLQGGKGLFLDAEDHGKIHKSCNKTLPLTPPSAGHMRPSRSAMLPQLCLRSRRGRKTSMFELLTFANANPHVRVKTTEYIYIYIYISLTTEIAGLREKTNR